MQEKINLSLFKSAACISLLFLAAGCTTLRQTSPQRTATEELLISTAAERAANDMAVQVPAGSKVFIDSTYFDGTDSKYALGAIHEGLLKHGVSLVDGKDKADIVIEVRAGALSTDENTVLVGIPSFDIPIPLSAGALKTPEIALFKEAEARGVAKFQATGYDQKDGHLVSAAQQDGTFGFSYQRRWVALLFFSWTTDDILPKEKGPSVKDFVPPVP